MCMYIYIYTYIYIYIYVPGERIEIPAGASHPCLEHHKVLLTHVPSTFAVLDAHRLKL